MYGIVPGGGCWHGCGHHYTGRKLLTVTQVHVYKPYGTSRQKATRIRSAATCVSSCFARHVTALQMRVAGDTCMRCGAVAPQTPSYGIVERWYRSAIVQKSVPGIRVEMDPAFLNC